MWQPVSEAEIELRVRFRVVACDELRTHDSHHLPQEGG